MTTNLSELPAWFNNGEIFAYPTEAVFGLGCDPLYQSAVARILAIKQRPVEKGLILIAEDYSQLSDYVDLTQIPPNNAEQMFTSWPDAVTWLVPKSSLTPNWISGDSELVAVRVSNHPIVKQMCAVLGKAIVSTSANPATLPPAQTSDEVRKYFGDSINIVEGSVGKKGSVSTIINSMNLDVIRA